MPPWYPGTLVIFRFPFVMELNNGKLYGKNPPAHRIKVEAEMFRKFVTAIAENLTKKLL